MSDSEYDDPAHHVNLPQNLGKGNLEDNKSSIRLYELGPRITFQLIKIEEDLMNGEVLYHDFIVKTEQEQEEIRKKRDVKKKLKQARKVQQDANLKRKEIQKEDNKKKSQKNRQATEHDKQLLKDAEDAIPDVPEDDKEYFRDEVGVEPEAELFQGQQSRKRPYVPKGFKQGIHKKPKLDGKDSKDKKKDGRRGKDDGDSFKRKRDGQKFGKKFGGKAGGGSKKAGGGSKKAGNRFGGSKGKGMGKKNKRK
jgi:ribosome biogenesis protein SSF1/2